MLLWRDFIRFSIGSVYHCDSFLHTLTTSLNGEEKISMAKYV